MATRSDDVVREDLLRRLPAATDEQQLVIVAAPGGWGKTTMLSTWDAWATDTQFGWCSLSPPDNDTNRFINRLIDTTSRLVGDGHEWPDPSESTPMVWVEQALPLMTEALGEVGPTALVLDDYHLIENPDAHGVVQSLLEQLDPESLLVLSTRADPPLKLARLRAARAVTELRSEDLQFTADDADLLLRTTFDLELSPQQIGLLVDTTEGWPAAISLAAQSLRTVNDPQEFLRRFVSTDRLIVDYLAEELLETLPRTHRSFLHDTSVVDMFVPDLAAALAAEADGDVTAGQIGEDLERWGLLTRHYEGNRVWFRYHQLLRDVLYRRLDPVTQRARHRAAGDWFEGNDQPRRAIEQLTAGDETQRATALITEHASDYILRGRYSTVMAWIDDLADRVEVDSGLSLLGAQATLYGGLVEKGRAWLARAESGADRTIAEQLLTDHLRTIEAFAEGRLVDAASSAEQVIDLYETNDGVIELDPGELAECLVIAGAALSLVGQTERSERWLDRTITVASTGDNQAPSVAALAIKSLLAFLDDDLAASRSLVDEAMTIATDMSLPPTSVHMMVPHMARALVGTEGEATEAVEYQRQISEYSYSMPGVTIGHICEAYFWLEVGDHEAADRALVAARDHIDELVQPSPFIDSYYDKVASRHPSNAGRRRPPGPAALTDRELQVLRAFSSNLTQREIGRELFLSFNTIKTYARSAYRKLGVESRSEAVRACREAGLF